MRSMGSISLLGVPHDENSSFMRGPAEAPDRIRRELASDAYSQWTETGVDLGADGRLVDRGDVRFDASTDAWAAIERDVGRALEAGDPLICLGGDHAVTHPILRAVRRRHPRLTLLHVDAHPDIYHAYQGNPRSHASPFARIMEEKLADRLVQVGLRTINDHHREQFERFGVEAYDIGCWEETARLRFDGPVYLSVDIDALDPAYAPGVSHREPGGLSTRQVIALIQSVRAPLVGADVVEYNPRNDISNLTALVAAKLVKEIGGMMASTDSQAVTSGVDRLPHD
jgi:agmatinase